MTKSDKVKYSQQEMLELAVAETALPAYLLWTASKAVILEGYVLRKDANDQLDQATKQAFGPLAHNPEAARRTAIRVDSAVRAMLNMLNADTPVHALYSCCTFTLRLVEEGLYADADNIAVLTAMLLMTELKENGGTEDYKFKEKVLFAAGGNLIAAARQAGLYLLAAQEPGKVHQTDGSLRMQ